MDPGGGLQPNTAYTLEIFGLQHRSLTRATINERTAQVMYLVTLDATLDLSRLNGGLYVGGYQDITSLGVSYIYFFRWCIMITSSMETFTA